VLASACAPAAPAGPPTPAARPATGSGGSAPAPAAAPAAPPTARALDRVTVGTPAKIVGNLPIYLAEEVGIFQDEGLEFDLTTVRGDTGVAAIISGSLDYITQTGSPDVLSASISGGELIAIQNQRDDPLLYVISQPHITSAQALRGGIVAHGGTRGTHYFATAGMMKHLGLEPDQDVQLLSVTDVAQGVAALFSGRVAAVTLTPPFDSIALSRGYHRLVAGADVLERFSEGGLTTQRRRLREQRDEARRLVRAFIRGVHYALDHPAEAAALIQREWELDEATARIAYETVVPSFNLEGMVSDAVWTAAVERAVREGQITRPDVRPGDYADWSLAREVRAALGR
jgi:NitT/TauT family transport system substrate-binding protein